MIRLRVVNLHSSACDVRVDRRTPFGNPYRMRGEEDRARVIERFRGAQRAWGLFGENELLAQLADEITAHAQASLDAERDATVTLGCWCAPAACHADVWIELLARRWPGKFIGGSAP